MCKYNNNGVTQESVIVLAAEYKTIHNDGVVINTHYTSLRHHMSYGIPVIDVML